MKVFIEREPSYEYVSYANMPTHTLTKITGCRYADSYIMGHLCIKIMDGTLIIFVNNITEFYASYEGLKGITVKVLPRGSVVRMEVGDTNETA